jgi:hypothetical protein
MWVQTLNLALYNPTGPQKARESFYLKMKVSKCAICDVVTCIKYSEACNDSNIILVQTSS